MSRRAVLVAVVVLLSFAITVQGQELASISGGSTPVDSHGEEAIAGMITVPPKTAAPITIPRFEIGAQTTMLRMPSTNPGCGGCLAPQFGFGPTVTLNLNRYLALDAAASFSPGVSLPTQQSGGRFGEALVGVKAAIHGSRWTLFAKARPGIISWSQMLQQANSGPALAGQDVRLVFRQATYFAVDLGGGLEYRVTPRVGLRAELEELFVRQKQPGLSSAPASFEHSVQTSAGVYYRFGRTVATEIASSGRPHRFFDRTNLMVMTIGMMAQASDAITTQRALANCRRYFAAAQTSTGACAEVETDPIARPFVNHGWAGQLSLGAIVNSAQMLAMYGIHRMGHHRIERFVPVPLAIASTYLGYSNLQKK